MSEKATGAPAQKKGGVEWIGVGVAVALVVGVLFFADWRRTQDLDRSAIGFQGLIAWLKANEVEARAFRGGDFLDEDRVGLRILPLYDSNLKAVGFMRRPDERPERERYMDTTERDIDSSVVIAKAIELPTLVILPKWRAGARLLGKAHPDLLIPVEGLEADVRKTAIPEAGALRRDETLGLTELRIVSSGMLERATLYAPQFAAEGRCVSLLGDPASMLLGRCEAEGGGRSYWVLTDPDLMNNHGLAQGRNAELALDLIQEIAGDRPVVLDLTTIHLRRGWGVDDGGEREWSDLSRFFEYPFSYIWLAFALLSALTIWRSLVRDRAPEPFADGGPGAARAVAIDAKARILRLTGQDAALARAYVADRLQALASEVLGPSRAPGQRGLAQLQRAIARKSLPLAETFASYVQGDGPRSAANAAETLAYLDSFDRFTRQVLDEFRDAQPARRPRSR